MIYIDPSIPSLEVQDLLEKVTDPDVQRLVETVMYEPQVWTRGGRINKSALCRILDVKPAILEDFFARLRNQFIDPEDVPLFRFKVLEDHLMFEGRNYVTGDIIQVCAVTKKLKKLVHFKKVVQLGKSG